MPPNLSRRQALQLAGATTAAGLVAPTAHGAPAESAGTSTVSVAAETVQAAAAEPNVAEALAWWHPQRQVWTPLGWKDHLFRFELFYNGSMLFHPTLALSPSRLPPLDGPRPYLHRDYRDQDFQVTVVRPNRRYDFPPLPTATSYLHHTDVGVGIQGWQQDKKAPVLWTEHRRQQGFVLKQSVFAHLHGGGNTVTGVEPLYAWTRFSVEEVNEVEAPAHFTFVLRFSRVHYGHRVDPPEQHEAFLTMLHMPAKAPLGTTLRLEQVFNPGPEPVPARIYDGANKVRLAVSVPGATTMKKVGEYYDLTVVVPARKGAYVDMCVPTLAMAQATIDQELALGYDGALAQAEAYWARTPATAAKVQTPEKYVDQFLQRSIQLAEVITETNPDTRVRSFLSGSYGYELLWSTPTSMISHMFLDLFGYHDAVASRIELYRTTQGTLTPPGTHYANLSREALDGYFGTPAYLQSFDWLTDHGAVLEIVCRHALLTRDQAFVNRWLEPIRKGCKFISEALASNPPVGVHGLMPPARSNDSTQTDEQSVWVQAWTYKGLSSAVQLLKRLNHPDATTYGQVADKFRAKYVSELRRIAASAPTWTDSSGTKHPVVPYLFYGTRGTWPHLELFDNGALVSVWAGLMPADDPLMKSFVEFFRSGPNTKNFDPMHHTALDRVVLDHEQGSGEPCYSWNIFHSWQLADRPRFLEGMYSLLTGGISPDTYISGEHRNAMYGNLFVQPLIAWSLRHAVIDDAIAPGELHLLRLCPLAWISADSETVFDRMPTLYGPMALRFRLSADGRTLTVNHSTNWAENPARMIVHRPPVPGLERLVVNGVEVSR